MATKNKKINGTNWLIYSQVLDVYWQNLIDKWELSEETLQLLTEFRNNLEVLTFYMLEGRFTPTLPKKKKSTRKRRADKPKSVALLYYLDQLPVEKEQTKPIYPLDIVKWFKSCETFILKREGIISIEELALGKFSKQAEKVCNILPKLLLVVANSPTEYRKDLLCLIFSMIVIYRQFKVKSIPDVSTITDLYDGSDLGELLENEFSDIKIDEGLNSLEIDFKNANALRLSIYSGNASSPNSGASATKLIEDAAAVRLDPKLRDAILGFAKEMPNNEHFIYLVEILFENIKDISDTIHSKLFHFTAKGGKARIIANVDGLTQTALSGFHFYMYKLLHQIPSDFTFNHKAGIDYVGNNKSKNDNFYSLDLSAATDRMPRLLQAQILKRLAVKLGLKGSEIAAHGLNIMDRSFSVKGTGMNNGQAIIYSVGQGMGVFTSGPIMAMTHHFIVNYLCGIKTENYALVGDDLLIRGSREQYEKYCYYLAKIGMKVNKNKTIVSERSDYNRTHSIEFARNYIIFDVPVLPIQGGVLYAGNDEKSSFEAFIYNMRSNITARLISRLTALFSSKLSVVSMFSLCYTIFKYKFAEVVENENMNALLCCLNTPAGFYKINGDRLHEAILLNKSKVQAQPKGEEIREEAPVVEFMANFRSDLVVRTKLDAIRALDLAKRLQYLKFIDDHIGYMALALSARLFNVELIRYDIDEFGNPLIPKSGRRLLQEIATLETAKEKKEARVLAKSLSVMPRTWNNLSYK